MIDELEEIHATPQLLHNKLIIIVVFEDIKNPDWKIAYIIKRHNCKMSDLCLSLKIYFHVGMRQAQFRHKGNSSFMMKEIFTL